MQQKLFLVISHTIDETALFPEVFQLSLFYTLKHQKLVEIAGNLGEFHTIC